MKKAAMIIAGIMNTAIAGAITTITVFEYSDQKLEANLARFDAEERYCLTQNIYFEARNQSELGQEAVGWVTLNRMDDTRYPDTICEVVWQDRQFSWTHDGKPDTPSDNVLEQEAWAEAEEIASDVLVQYATNQADPTQGAVMYHADYVNPYWARAYAMVSRIESHIFYK